MPTLLEVSEQAKQLTVDEKTVLCHQLLTDLETPDPDIQALWLEEVRRRVLAHREDPQPTFSEEEVMAGLLDL